LQRYNVVLVAPPGYAHAEALREAAETLQHGLRRLGKPAETRVNGIDPGATNLVLGAHLLDEAQAASLPDGSILCNFEQVLGDSPAMKPPYVALVRRHLTWDYSARNVVGWRRYVPDARVVHVPLGFVPELERIESSAQPDIDVLFYGSVNPRRAKVLDALKAAGLHVVTAFGSFGAERDALIARAKVVLSVHFYESRIFELARVSYLLANRKAVVAEVGAGTEIDDDLREAVAGVPYDALVGRCRELVRDAGARARLAEEGHRRFSARAEERILAQALAAEPPASGEGDAGIPTRLNVGSGKGWNLEWLNLDADPGWMPDLVADLNEPLPPAAPVDLGRFGRRVLPEGHFDEIRASHVLEHVSSLTTAMASFLRLLKEGGVLSVEVPYDLSHGAWQDPTHVRAFNERSWLYYTEWSWYLQWREFRFEMTDLGYILSDVGRAQNRPGLALEELARIPRAVDAIRVRLRKRRLTDPERQRLLHRWA
jgi:SAM-dependent methyltransferase